MVGIRTRFVKTSQPSLHSDRDRCFKQCAITSTTLDAFSSFPKRASASDRASAAAAERL